MTSDFSSPLTPGAIDHAREDFDRRQNRRNLLESLAHRAAPLVEKLENPVPTGTEAAICADIARRQELGRKKYGTTVAENPLTHRQWLQHLYEELLDAAIYAKREIEKLDAEGKQSATAE